MSNKKKFLANIGWLVGGRILNMILQFVVSLATARFLGPSNLGIINYVAAYVAFFSSIASLGLAIVVIKEIASGRENEHTVIFTSITMRLISAFFSAIAVIACISVVEKNDTLMIYIAVLSSVEIIFRAFETISCWFQAKLMSKYIAIAGVAGYVAMSLFRIVLLICKADVLWFAFSSSMDAIFSAIFFVYFYIKKNGFQFSVSIKISKNLLLQSWPFMMADLTTIIYSQIDKMMLGKMLNQTMVGYYSITLTIATLWSLISSALMKSIIPVLYEISKLDKSLYVRRLRQSYFVIFWLNVLYSLFITIFAKWVIILLYGEAFLPAQSALIIVVWYYGIASMGTLTQSYLANEGKNKYVNIFCSIGLVVNILLNYTLIPILGINGAAMATLITHITVQILAPLAFHNTREVGILIVEAATLQKVINKNEIILIKNKINNIRNRKSK